MTAKYVMYLTYFITIRIWISINDSYNILSFQNIKVKRSNYKKNENRKNNVERVLSQSYSCNIHDSDLVNEDGVTVAELERQLVSSCDLEEGAYVDCRTNITKLLSELISTTILKDFETIVPLTFEYTAVVNKHVNGETIYIYSKFNSHMKTIRKEINNVFASLNESTVQELRELHKQLNEESIFDTIYLRYTLSNLNYSSNFSAYSPLTNFFKSAPNIYKQLKRFAIEINRKAYFIRDFGIMNLDYYPVSFVTKYVNFRALRINLTSWDLIFVASESLRNLLHNIRHDRIYVRHTISLSVFEDSKTIISNVLNIFNYYLKRNICLLLKYLQKETKGELKGVLALFLYIFKTKETSNRHIHFDILQKYKHYEYMKRNVKILCDKEKYFLKEAENAFTERMHSLFNIDLKKRNFFILSKQLSNSVHLKDILELFKDVVVLKLYRNIVWKFLHILEKIEKVFNKKKEKLRLQGDTSDAFPSEVRIPRSLKRYIKRIYETEQNTITQLTFIMLRQRAFNEVFLNMMETEQKIKKLLRWLRLIVDRKNTTQQVIDYFEKKERATKTSSVVTHKTNVPQIRSRRVSQTSTDALLEPMDDANDSPSIISPNINKNWGEVYLLLYLFRMFAGQ